MSAVAAKVHRLRAELEARFGGAILPGGAPTPFRKERPGFRSNISALDQLLPQGVPRGALSLWSGEATAGRTAAVRALVESAGAAGARSALVDATRTLGAELGCRDGRPLPGLWVVRPPQKGMEHEGPWATESLLRTGVFDLIVLDGCLPDDAQTHRLRALAREHDVALVISVESDATSGSGGTGGRPDLRLSFRRVRAPQSTGLFPGGRFRQRARVSERYGGEREVELVYEPADRLRSGPRWPDRRC